MSQEAHIRIQVLKPCMIAGRPYTPKVKGEDGEDTDIDTILHAPLSDARIVLGAEQAKRAPKTAKVTAGPSVDGEGEAEVELTFASKKAEQMYRDNGLTPGDIMPTGEAGVATVADVRRGVELLLGADPDDDGTDDDGEPTDLGEFGTPPSGE